MGLLSEYGVYFLLVVWVDAVLLTLANLYSVRKA